MNLRSAKVSDAEAICKVLINSISANCAADHQNNKHVLHSWCQNKTPENVAEWIRNPENITIVVENNNNSIVGVGLVTTSGEIKLCYLLPEVLNKGIGTTLLKRLEQEVLSKDIKKIHLHSTITAHNFYKKNGYTNIGDPIKLDDTRKCYPMQKNFNDTKVAI